MSSSLAGDLTPSPIPSPTMTAPLEDFFAQFATLGFAYNQNSTAHNNFARLRRTSGWNSDPATIASLRVDFNDALVQQFNFLFGTDSDLGAWQNLCGVIDITPVPDTIDDCTRLVWDANVNIVDLLESMRTGEPVHKFATLDELRVYTRKNKGKMFPKESAYTGGLLKELLREIINPYLGNRRNGSAKRKGRRARRRAAAAAQSSP
ncbi:hypothetical protein JVU11DRAFT_12394 [Chiua virens]|nr:hypothetical protein JVU11DRAFT_12394 [Chiua virens]